MLPKEVSHEEAYLKEANAEEADQAMVLTGKRIVIVEDEGITQLQLRKMLTRAGLNVVGSAGNGREGVEVILREQPDIVLMDINMPEMNGLEATKLVLQTHKTCVIILTAYTDESHRLQAQEAGASGYLLKPVTSDTLLPVLIHTYAANCE